MGFLGEGLASTRLRVSGAGLRLGSPLLGCRSRGSGLGVRTNLGVGLLASRCRDSI